MTLINSVSDTVNGTITFRRAVPGDAAGIAICHLESWKAQMVGLLTPDQLKLKDLDESNQIALWQARLADEEGRTRHTFVAERRGELLGYASGGADRSGSLDYDCELYQLYILPSAQRQGLGKRLVGILVRRLQQLGYTSMIVWTGSISPAVDFYRDTLGGIPVTERPLAEGGGLFEAALGWRTLTELAALSRPDEDRDSS